MGAEAKDRRAEPVLQGGHRHDVGVERRRRAREDNQRRPKAVALQAFDDVIGRQAFCRRVDQTDLASGPAQELRHQRERVGRLGRAEHVLALLASALTRESHAVDERRIDEKRTPAEKVSSHQRTTVRGIARRGATPWGKGSATGSGDSSTLQQRRQTGKMP